MFDSLISWLLLPLGLALGWYLGRRTAVVGPGAPLTHGAGLPPRYSSDPDEAIAALLEASANDPRSLGLQVSLGVLFRKRGEVDRALRVHEALLQRPDLAGEERDKLRFELAQDYAKGGMMDRAEAEFLALADEGIMAAASLEALRGLFEQGHDWEQALEANRRFESCAGSSQHHHAAQYCCELAESALAAAQLPAAEDWARRATGLDANAPRPWLVLARIHERQQRVADAADALYRAIEADARFLPEALEALWRCEQASGQEARFMRLFEDVPSQGSSVLAIKRADLMQAEGMNPLETLSQAFIAHPSWLLLERLAECAAPSPDAAAVLARAQAPSPTLVALRDALRRASKRRPRYRCSHCGLQPGILFWQCPSCRHWGRVAPVDDLIDA